VTLVDRSCRPASMDLQLRKRRALITGGSRGIGLAIATALAAEGVEIALAARDRSRVEQAAATLADTSGRQVIGLTVDTGDDTSVHAMVEAATAALGGIDILVNNAATPGGQSPPPKLAGVTTDVLWADVNVKVMGYLRTAREIAPQMMERGWGRIINISGLAARQTGSTIGSIRNVAVAALTANLADELGPYGINVTVVHPGLTRTEKTESVIADRARTASLDPSEVERRMAAGVRIGRIVDASEVADVVTFLASPRSVAINGDAVTASGGARGAIHY
jgi:NAD(P)-dependent dehydrogenase (short-subunit alcohol dehydrogenase family)